MALKKTVLSELSQCLFDTDSARRRDFERFVKEHPVVNDYARFRAILEKQGKSWRLWSEPLRRGSLKDGDYDETEKRYHMYVQWLAHEQVRGIAEQAGRKDICLYLDLPLGAHPDGYDIWRYQDVFVPRVSVGAPPDTVFTRGQNWAFPPLHPERIRQQGYQYVIECLRHHLQYAGILRIDHVMGLHRLYFIPEGSDSGQGAYVHYHPQEMYAILALESQRYQSIIVGEDLGIVPDEVRTSMNRYGLNRMYVMHYELAANAQPLLRPIPNNAVASLNTHDMPPFVSFWRGQDIRDRLKVGILNQAGARRERAIRATVKKRLVAFLRDRGWLKETPDEPSVLEGCLSYLSASRAQMVMVNLEDLWLETRTQNIPSTTEEHPNWRRKARYDFDTFCQMPQVATILKEVTRLRGSQDFHDDTGRKTQGK
jgi:4-alpha-glucanotransferase